MYVGFLYAMHTQGIIMIVFVKIVTNSALIQAKRL